MKSDIGEMVKLKEQEIVARVAARCDRVVKAPRQPKWRRQAKGLDVNTSAKGTEKFGTLRPR